MRVVLEGGSEPRVQQMLAPLGAELEPTAADFEDLFLTRLREGT